jgi:hypothetical protein
MDSPAQPTQDELALFREAFEVIQGKGNLGKGNLPFPWQEQLFECFCRGDFPSALDLPTGLGKTSVMAIWLLARALADEANRNRIPRRLVYVVDRRAVVDQATAEAEKLRDWLDGAADPKVRLGLGERRLPISTLRGQHLDNREWLTHPITPAIVVGTVDMIGSRLLFSGYGVSTKMRPYHAGFLGADTLVVLDEAHLVPPFEALLKAITRDAQRELGTNLPHAGAPNERVRLVLAVHALLRDRHQAVAGSLSSWQMGRSKHNSALLTAAERAREIANIPCRATPPGALSARAELGFRSPSRVKNAGGNLPILLLLRRSPASHSLGFHVHKGCATPMISHSLTGPK